ncbi:MULTISPECIES: beta-galactosidase GalB [Asticcacaulis]|uniref:beta-galactosidase GalB n=1 Tax=Asticcacaulis TaxID=76890 RepID=UPI001AE9D938|nr:MULTISPECIES: beta-galactosidase GalB [Asticcacaulis]MBP2159342.1 beta-galactosidase [Asticcacaulis solisilvae]MDR6800387.1 beta-galactosidase [Asticcacaulis sp. BE141]
MRFAKPSVFAIMAALMLASPATAAPRERLSINDGWRFTMGDPEGTGDKLLYDIRPVVDKSADGKEADARPDAAVKVDAGTQTVLKPWILPTANPLIKDPAKRHLRPAGDPGSDVAYVTPGFDDSAWRKVTLPHDWAIEGPFLKEGPYGGMGRLKTWGPVWYRKVLDIPAADKGKSVFLDIDGAMSYATVWLNGRLVGGWPYGYSSWRVDLTPYLTVGGKNQLAIRLDNPPESARWYPGAGLYRNVWLTKANPVHIAQWGTFVTTPEVSKTSATVALDVAIDNDSAADTEVSVATKLYVLNADGSRSKTIAASIASATARVPAKGKAHLKGTTALSNPRLWGPPPTQTPNRYVAVTTVTSKGKVIDSYETPFGVREVKFDPDKGVFVNGERIELKGVNNHHDLGSLGAAFNVRAAERQLEMLQEMGANSLRMSHNPPAPELLELTDKMGILVIDEVFDSWERKKTPLDFHLVFPDWHEPDLRAMLRRDRNNPSVILWSVGNEVGEQYTGQEGAAIGRKLVEIVREEDPTRPATNAMNWAQADMPLPAEMDVINLNYQGAGIRTLPGKFPAFRQKHPDKVIITSESASALSSRGEYQFPVPGVYSAAVRPGVGGDPKTKQVSAYELFAADFGTSADRSWSAQDQHPYVAGEFVWTGFDYIGEPTPYYDARSSYSGIIDLAGFKKDRFWLYQARWKPDVPMAHILPHWTWPGREGEVTPVHVFTSGDEAELFVNGVSQGRKKKALYEYRLRWDFVTYQPGSVKVVTYKNGKEWATEEVTTAGAAAKLDASADRTTIAADGKDLSFVTVRIADAQGRMSPRANNRIRFRIEGPGEIVATDNGDPTSFESFQSPDRDAFNGLALVVVRARKGQAGKIAVHAEADGLTGSTVALTARKP